MNKTLIEVIVVLVLGGTLASVVYFKKDNEVVTAPLCPLDVMMCPDGTSVQRSGAACEFDICKQDLPEYLQKETVEVATTTLPTQEVSTHKETPVVTTSLFKKIKGAASSVISSTKEAFSSDVSSGITETSSAVTEANTQVVAPSTQTQTITTTPTQAHNLNETRFEIENGNIVDGNGNTIYTIPPSTSSSGWTTHVVDVVPVSDVAPVIGAVPVTGLPGKFYLSENSFGSLENCEFSNKIYILDTKTNNKILMYEENNTTLAHDDVRSCNSEIYLLATEAQNLILKYHTIGTNMTCDSSWSEPEKTWFLDVTNLSRGMLRYRISPALYSQAEQEETACRAQFEEATSTQESGIGG